ncbi:Hypothetical predicted protein [Paramuricea clavata]|uniref:Uncharacterized protein n=1 Tax=Paramuricea clavata TaxID=317549 RepID=A0A7D9J0Z3_PARCT|nr:Hypothetical predicted protein [Paramuricea clavata]
MNFCHLMILLLEPLASSEEVAKYKVDEAVAEDEQLENMLQNRFEGHVDMYRLGSYAQFSTDSSWFGMIIYGQFKASHMHYRVVVTIKYDQHSRTRISELTRSLKKQLDGSSSFVSVLFAVSPNSFKI